jgi:small subunit ribosomal protein S8
MITDPISDMLTRIRNASVVKKTEVVLPFSKFKHNLANILMRQKKVQKVEVEEKDNRKFLKIHLRYDDGVPAISGLSMISKPGQRIYSGASKIPKPKLGHGFTIVSTSRGLMTDKDARTEKIGGEVICQIW